MTVMAAPRYNFPSLSKPFQPRLCCLHRLASNPSLVHGGRQPQLGCLTLPFSSLLLLGERALAFEGSKR